MSNSIWQGANVMITGVSGTVGKELLSQVLDKPVASVVGIDNNETEVFFVNEQFSSDPRVSIFLADLRNRDMVVDLSRNMDIILHAAALKHVGLCEASPREAVQTNILGVENIIHAAKLNGVKRVLFTSSDKAVNPTNVMGTSKLMGERLISAANAHRKSSSDPIFTSTRFGNVLGSRGSVIPLFKKQIAAGQSITLTDEQMTRFIMTLGDACRLVTESVEMARGGEVLVTKMPVVYIKDLAEVMRDELAPRYGLKPEEIEITIIGSKPGEKLYEELMNDEEVRRTQELENYFVVTPAFQPLYESIDYQYDTLVAEVVDRPYNSSVESTMTKEELREYLIANRLLEDEA